MARKRSPAARADAEENVAAPAVAEKSSGFGLGNTASPEGPRRTYTAEQTRQHIAAVAKALEDGWGIDRVMRAAPQIGITRGRAKVLVMRIWEENRIADAQERQHARVLQIKRVLRHLDVARTPDKKTGKIAHQAIARYETILAQLQGTFEPIEVNVVDRVAQSLVPTISGLTGSQIDAYTHRAQERKVLAAIASKMLEAKRDSEAIDVKGEAAE